MKKFDARYIDIQGDGLMAIFDGHNSYAKGFIAATTFRTYIDRYLAKRISSRTDGRINLKTRSGLSYGSIIVKRVGTRSENKEVWAYHRVNQAAKLAKISPENGIAVSAGAYEKLSRIDWIENSCGCSGGTYTGEKKCLWHEVEQEHIEPYKPLITKAFTMTSTWCPIHGEEYLQNIIRDCDLDMPYLRAKTVGEMYDSELYDI